MTRQVRVPWRPISGRPRFYEHRERGPQTTHTTTRLSASWRRQVASRASSRARNAASKRANGKAKTECQFDVHGRQRSESSMPGASCRSDGCCSEAVVLIVQLKRADGRGQTLMPFDPAVRRIETGWSRIRWSRMAVAEVAERRACGRGIDLTPAALA